MVRLEAMTDDDIKKLVSQTVADTLIKLGIDTEDPAELQRDMIHLREWRQSIGTVKRQGLITAIGIVTAGVLGAIWLAIKGTGNA